MPVLKTGRQFIGLLIKNVDPLFSVNVSQTHDVLYRVNDLPPDM